MYLHGRREGSAFSGNKISKDHISFIFASFLMSAEQRYYCMVRVNQIKRRAAKVNAITLNFACIKLFFSQKSHVSCKEIPADYNDLLGAQKSEKDLGALICCT